MKSEYQRDEEAKEYYLSGKSGQRLYSKALEHARTFGESFVMFIGSVANPNTCVRWYTNRDDAIEDARYERSLHVGFHYTPKVTLRRLSSTRIPSTKI